MSEPHWEHGYRCHGYFLEGKRVGFVGLPPRKTGGVKVDGYGVGLDSEDLQHPPFHPSFKTLKAAKQYVERIYKEKIHKLEE